MPTQWKLTPSKAGTPAKATFQCPHCGVYSLHTCVVDGGQYNGHSDIDLKLPAGPFARSEWRDTRIPCTVTFTHWIMRCVNCEKDTYVLTKSNHLPVSSIRVSPDETDWLKFVSVVVHQFPVWNPSFHESVPAPISRAVLEAEKCLSVGANNACAVMTRRAIHSLSEDKNAEGKDLFGQLRDLKSKQIITPDLHEWADSLRVLGRDGAHPEFPEVTAEDAEDGVKLLREIIKYVYILPFERAEKRQKG